MPNRILWTCPGCRRDFRIPSGAATPDFCPDCVAQNASKSKAAVQRATAEPATPDARESNRILIRNIAWGVFLLWAVGVAFSHFMLGDNDRSAVQQAARAADNAFWMIFGYAVARAVDSLFRR